MKHKFLAVILAMAMLLSLVLTGCAQNPTPPADQSGSAADASGEKPSSSAAMTMVGISMGSEETSGEAGKTIQTELEAAGYTVELAYADTDKKQSEQISAMVEDGASVLVVDPVDGTTVKTTLESISVDVSNVAVIVYRDPLDSPAVDSYVGRDCAAMGRQQAEHIAERLGLADMEEGDEALTIELMTSGDAGSTAAFNGAMEVLKPYIDEGKLEIASEKNTAAACTTADPAKYVEELCTGAYAEKELYALLCLGENQAVPAIEALASAYTGTVYPVITGANDSAEALYYMNTDLLSMISYSSLADLRNAASDTVLTIANAPDSLKKEYLIENTAVTKAQLKEVFVDSELYTDNGDKTFTKN